MVVLEAMANGVPVVAADVEGIPQAIRPGEDGMIFPPGDSHRLAGAIRAFVDGDVDWIQVRQSALDRQGKMFSDISMAQGVAAVYRRVLEQRKETPRSRQ